MEKDSRIRIVNDYAVEIENEDHTMMNPLRWCIGRNFSGDHVELVGYTIPHPSDNVARLSVQFSNENMQKPQNILDKIAQGLESMEAICSKLLIQIEGFESSSRK
ncbi:subunit AC19 of RNA polymerase [Ordospora colligata]|uniref:Subunit AC19 of RNA polymerase n=1 Tax=Ordospora colligata OC4 TaxID=1354746 RepID=A0A0B2UIF9_9MICR|nr:subunit AC19 of RNA polymerase [Ordospora colligata OC4]KHN68827.1 subunit AC19 of RNA polymerase [Ordospora colligata OC4]TBU13861.1 subunit AC19 of RNA polymerase [Ordospora colligata]TBU14050.1 subunit AC19 of RNA polymerase [Ordospora colligata]TBU17719.1 subunit AC19 of RNA polymerase [Ordospora colligata]